MVWAVLANGDGQVVKGIRLADPYGKEYVVIRSHRRGINKYEIVLHDEEQQETSVMNHQLKDWEVVGRFHTPEELAAMFGRKFVDPDANKKRIWRKSYWRQRNNPMSHSGRQKIRAMLKYPDKYAQFQAEWEEYKAWVIAEHGKKFISLDWTKESD